ncbi:MAG: helicase-related protein [Gemmatimonadota bacterium]
MLAEQHFQSLSRLAGPLGVRLALLVGGQGTVLRRELLTAVASGSVQLVVGTHALLRPEVRFPDLALVVVDEQHRFGVTQRQALYEKGPQAHVLIMTATPIPRSLALTLYGDLDVSVLDELPAGRQPIRTALRTPDRRDRIFAFVAEELRAGRQAYIIYPLIEESGRSDLTSALEAHAELCAGPLAGFEVGLLHGRLPAEEKARTMEGFVAGRIQALVSTTVIEVGVDVPNASVIVIEHAERFGLAQLHQMRGRVGRGAAASYCILVAYPSEGETDPTPRLEALCQTQDGFALARRDLELRGPGELLGTRQAGVPDLVVADPVRDEDLLVLARELARSGALP